MEDPRIIEARCLGTRAASHVIAAVIDQPELASYHWRKWAHNEQMLREFIYSKHKPELIP